MKLIQSLAAGAVGLSLIAAVSAQTPAQTSPAPSAPAQTPVKFDLPNIGGTNAPAASPSAPLAAPAPKYTSAQLMELYGYILGRRASLAELEFSPDDVAAIARGIAASARGEQPNVDVRAMEPELEAYIGKKGQAFMGKLRNHNLAESATFFTKLKDNKNVQELPDGLRYEVLKPGTGASPKLGQIVKMQYTGQFIDGTTFDSSVQRGEPVEVFVQAPSKEDPRGVIAGMVEGLQKAAVGGKYKLYIPPHLAYGDDGTQGIPPAATLIFEVEVLDVKDAPKEATPAK
ncbi:MAG TPA: FKBP-type peptidyl-prolyl cis-trans isomerase [Candidatus Didemnitutus sp.]|nr:FKBP-type peptidyl-prolyl cis-trans isomerase [Candidatus Didemnitutus sp.]